MKNKIINWYHSPAYKNFTSSLLSILLGIIIGFIIMFISKPNVAFTALGRLLIGPFNNARGGWIGLGQLFYRATPIIFTGLAVAFAFKTGVFNIGASGQYMIGLFVAVVIGVMGTSLGSMQWIIALIAGGIAGALWGSVPGIFRAYFNVNVVITGIMMNYIAVFFMNGLLNGVLKSRMVNSANNRTIKVAQTARTPYFFLDKIFPNSGADFGIILAIIVVIALHLILSKTVFGRDLKSVGLNRDAAKYAGVNEKRAIITSMAISGFLAAIGGALFILAPSVRNLGNQYALEAVVLPAGFDGIPVALLGHNNPIGVLFATLFITYIKISNVSIQSLGIAAEMVDVIVSIILYFSAFSLIVGQYVSKKLKKHKAEEVEV